MQVRLLETEKGAESCVSSTVLCLACIQWGLGAGHCMLCGRIFNCIILYFADINKHPIEGHGYSLETLLCH